MAENRVRGQHIPPYEGKGSRLGLPARSPFIMQKREVTKKSGICYLVVWDTGFPHDACLSQRQLINNRYLPHKADACIAAQSFDLQNVRQFLFWKRLLQVEIVRQVDGRIFDWKDSDILLG